MLILTNENGFIDPERGKVNVEDIKGEIVICTPCSHGWHTGSAVCLIGQKRAVAFQAPENASLESWPFFS
jgi:hypothetical protein